MKSTQSKNTGKVSSQRIQIISDAEYEQVMQELEKADQLNYKGKTPQANIKYKSLVQKIEKLLAIYPLDADLWKLYGDVLSSYRKDAKSISAYKQSNQLNPGQWDVFYNSGIVYARQKQWQPAIDSFNRVLKFREVPVKDREYCYLWLSEFYEKQKDYGNSLKAYQKGWNLEKDKPWLLLESARMANILKRPQVVQRYLKLFFNTSNEWDKLTAVKDEDFKIFRKSMLIYYFQSLEGNPVLIDSYVTNELDYYRNSSASSETKKNKLLMMAEKYKAKIARQLQQYPKDGILWFQFARLCLRLKESEDYLKFCQKAYRYNHHLLQVPFSLVCYYKKNKQWKESVRWINLLIRNHDLGKEEMIFFGMMKAELYEKMKEYGMAINAYKKCHNYRESRFFLDEIKRITRKVLTEENRLPKEKTSVQ